MMDIGRLWIEISILSWTFFLRLKKATAGFRGGLFL